VQGIRYAIGNAELMRELGVSLPSVKEHGSVVYICSEQRYLGYFVVCDRVKPNAAHALALLKRQGVGRIVMLTGATTENARSVGEALGIGEIRAQLLPGDKVAHLEALLGEDRCVAFVGDGINDAPVLARADIGIAMGGIGSDVAIESADAVLMRDDLSALPFALGVARKTMRIVRQNIALALAAKAVILLLAAFGIAGMWIAVFGDVGVMLLAVCNAIRATAARS
jgi:Cd2+/Zn2+-exporting ATPase